jgi:polyribonucleotide nucleotidyltransferase
VKKIEKSIQLGGRKLTLATGELAEQATSAVMASYGETVVLAAVVAAPLKVDPGYFPLSIEYQERLYAGGRIKGSRWVKREGRPTDDEILSGRLIDRSIRPLFPSTYKKDVQVTITVLSVDMENDPSILSGIATSAALAASEIPWKGPVSVLRVGRKDGKFVTNPVNGDLEGSDMDLVVSSSKDAIIMLEAGAKEISEEDMLEGIEYAQKESKDVLDLINDFAKEVGKEKESAGVEMVTEELKAKVKKLVDKDLEGIISSWAKHEGGLSLEETKKALIESLEEEKPENITTAFEEVLKTKVREMLLSGKRPDGRKLDEIRPLSCRVGILPRTHGSAIFQRGQTQVMSVVTLGAPSLEQLIESAEGEESKRYMHHYIMPPYSMGETGKVGFPSRREIGHGALAERALVPVIPSEEEFPYAIRVVSEVLSTNGSTSMASTCGSTLALMDAGVPIKTPVAGIAMGLVVESVKKYIVLTDIIGVEDFMGDMDFKVTGTEKGVTGIQLDVKTLSLTPTILKDALAKAKKARIEILKVMAKAIAKPRESVSTHAPKIKVIKVPQEKIGEVIGPGGRVIKGIIAETGAQVEVEDDGVVNISGLTDEEVNKAYEKVKLLVKEVVPGEIYDGEVKRVESFGAFVEILPGRDGMVHVSDMSMEYVADAHDKVNIGDKVQVRVKEIDNLGRINLSMLLDPSADKEKKEKRGNGGDQGRERNFSKGGNSFKRFSENFSGGRDSRRRDDRGRSFDRPKSSGPHFPTSRLMEEKKGF